MKWDLSGYDNAKLEKTINFLEIGLKVLKASRTPKTEVGLSIMATSELLLKACRSALHAKTTHLRLIQGEKA